MGEDFERERQDYFDRISGVGEWENQRFLWSRWAWDIAWHPAMLKGRSGHQPRPSRWDALKPVLFMLVVFGIPALAIFLGSGRFNISAKLIVIFAVLGGGLWIAMAAAHATVWRAHANAPKSFPHPGPKGRHQHR